MKQPKYFYTSTPTQQKVPVVSVPTVADEPIVVPHPLVEAVKRFQVSSRMRFSAGLLTLGVLASLGFLSYRHYLPPVHLFPEVGSSGSTVLQQKGGGSNGLQFEARTSDARVDIVASFLERYDSPLSPYDHYAKALVESADRYGLDYRLLPAIMMQESNLCKRADPAIHNCLGFGIHERGTLAFDSYEESFDRAARELKQRYIDIGLTTPDLIMKKYTPGSNGSWANSVNQWIAEMEHNDRSRGIANTGDADLTAYGK